MRHSIVFLALALVACAPREWVRPDAVPAQIGQQSARVAALLAGATEPRAKLALGIAEGSLRVAAHALTAGQAGRAQQELQVAIDQIAAACRVQECAP